MHCRDSNCVYLCVDVCVVVYNCVCVGIFVCVLVYLRACDDCDSVCVFCSDLYPFYRTSMGPACSIFRFNPQSPTTYTNIDSRRYT